MAEKSRTLKLSILGDVSDLNKSLKTAGGDVDSFGDKIGKAGAKIGKAFAAAAAAAGAAAIAIGIEGVKAAIADEKAQTQLALALENATGATQAQIKATEQSILQMSLATGVADDDLRPALGRLVRSTGDTEKAQQLLAQALDISAATGKPLETVAAALSKGFDGNTAALGKLGIGLSAAELKTMSFEQVQSKLSDLFGGAAAANAETYAGQIARVQVAFDEAKETIGTALLPILGKLLDFINKAALPAINAFSGAFSLTKGDGFGKVISDVATVIRDVATPIFEAMRTQFGKVKDVIVDNKENLQAFFEVVKFVAPIIGKVLGAAVSVIGDIATVVLTIIGKVLGAIKPLLNTAIDGINLIIKGYNAIQFGKDVPAIPKIGATSGTSGSAGFSGAMPGGQTFSTSSGLTAASSGGVATAAKVAATTSAAASKVAASNAGATRSTGTASAGTTINLSVNGAIDKEGTARTIVETLNNSFYRGTGGASAFVTA
jgi:phage-related protein